MSNAREVRNTPLSPVEYIQGLFEPSDRLAILLRNRDHGATSLRITTAQRIIEDSFQNWLRFRNQKQLADVYVCMNPLKPGARSRTRNDIQMIRHLYLYLDLDSEAAHSLAAVEQSDLVPKPNAVIRTSPMSLQLIWRVEGFGLDEAEAMLRVMARTFGGNPGATDAPCVLRVPGFRNCKYEQRFIVSAMAVTEKRYSLRDFRMKT